jgi:cytoskeletal protein CcmA (bactofilin family)
MLGSRRKTVIAKGLKIEGRVAEGLVELNGQIEGELHGTSLIISRRAVAKGAVSADQVVVDGTIEGRSREGRSFSNPGRT